jgi:hypothetical protein
MSSRARRRKCSGNGSAATAARATNAFAIQTPERMRAFPSERMVQPVPTSLGHSCRGGVNLLDGSSGGRTRRRGSPQGLSNQPYRVGAQARCPAPSDDIRAMSAFASHSEYVRGPKMPIHWSPPKASPVGFGSCEQSRAAGPSVVSHFSLMRGGRHRAHRTETSRLMLSMLAKGKQGVTKIDSASVRSSRHTDAVTAAPLYVSRSRRTATVGLR